MDQEPSVMSDLDASNSQNIQIILVRMEGKLDLTNQRLSAFERDISGIRQRLHDIANQVTPIVMLDLPARIRTADTHRAEHDARITALENVEQQRKGAAALVKVLWAIAGAVGVGGAAAVLRLFGAS